jgi:hypothetical protein
MELIERGDQWIVAPQQEGRIRRILIDYRLGLEFSDSVGTATLFVGAVCRLRGPGLDALVTPGSPLGVAPILPFFNAEVLGVTIQKTGHLILALGGDHFLEVDPDASYEAWEFACQKNTLFVCSPGGGIALFQEPGRG